MPQFLTPDSDQRGEFGLTDNTVREGKKHKGPERHSAKAHRCVDKVGEKGHDESSAWAICTASMGKDRVYAKGHGGDASPKRRRTREADVLDREAEAIIREHNDCHSPDDGRFCGKGGGGSKSGSEHRGEMAVDDAAIVSQYRDDPRFKEPRARRNESAGWFSMVRGVNARKDVAKDIRDARKKSLWGVNRSEAEKIAKAGVVKRQMKAGIKIADRAKRRHPNDIGGGWIEASPGKAYADAEVAKPLTAKGKRRRKIQ